MSRKLVSALFFFLASLIAGNAFAVSSPVGDEGAAKTIKSMTEQEFEQAKKLEAMHDKAEVQKWITLAIAFTIGLSVLGGAVGQGVAGSGALAGVARNPGAKDSIQPLLILVLALIESLVIYALVIAILLYTKLG